MRRYPLDRGGGVPLDTQECGIGCKFPFQAELISLFTVLSILAPCERVDCHLHFLFNFYFM